MLKSLFETLSSKGHEPADMMDAAMDAEEATRKRARIEARRKFRIVTSTIVACGRFRFVLEVDAEKPEQAEREILSSLGNLGLQPFSDESVCAPVATYQGQDTTHPRVRGLCWQQTYGFLDSQFCNQPRGTPSVSRFVTSSCCHEGFFPFVIFHPDADAQAHGELVTMLYGADVGNCSTQNHAYSPEEPHNSEQYQQNEVETSTQTNAVETGYSEHSIIQRQQTMPYEQVVWTFLDKPDSTLEHFIPESGVKETDKRSWSDWAPLENLRKIDDNTQHWATLVSDLNAQITRKMEELEEGSGRAKVQKLSKDAEEITKRVATVGSASEGKRPQKLQPKATFHSLPTIRDAGQYVSEIFDKLNLHVNELTNNMHGLQKQANSLTAMARLIEDGRKALGAFGRSTDWISEKLTTLQKDLRFRELTVNRHFQKCAEVLPALVESFLKERRGNFISVSSLIAWYFEDISSRQSVKVSSSLDDEEFLNSSLSSDFETFT